MAAVVVMAFAAALAIVLIAARIVIGWVSPTAGAAFGRVLHATNRFVVKLSVVILAGVIIYLAVGAYLSS